MRTCPYALLRAALLFAIANVSMPAYADEAIATASAPWWFELPARSDFYLMAEPLVNPDEKVVMSYDLRASINAPRAIPEVHLFVNAPFATVQQAIVQSIVAFGHFDSTISQIYLTRTCQDARPEDLDKVEELSHPVTRFTAIQRTRRGLFGRAETVLEIDIDDVTSAFGHPATAVRMRRLDVFPNHAKSDSNSGDKASASYVPASVFNAVRDAMASTQRGGRVDVVRTPREWAGTACQ